jgi:hypothetical protein
MSCLLNKAFRVPPEYCSSGSNYSMIITKTRLFPDHCFGCGCPGDQLQKCPDCSGIFFCSRTCRENGTHMCHGLSKACFVRVSEYEDTTHVLCHTLGCTRRAVPYVAMGRVTSHSAATHVTRKQWTESIVSIVSMSTKTFHGSCSSHAILESETKL